MADQERTELATSNISTTKNATVSSPPKDQETATHDQSHEAENAASAGTADIAPEDNEIVDAVWNQISHLATPLN